MRVLYLFSIKLRKFWHTARLSRTNHHKVIKSENSPFFGPPCILCYSAPRREQIIVMSTVQTSPCMFPVATTRSFFWWRWYVMCTVFKKGRHQTHVNSQLIFIIFFTVRFSSKFAAKYSLKMPPHLILCEASVSENEQESQTNAVIKDKLRYAGIVSDQSKTGLLLGLLEKIFFNHWIFDIHRESKKTKTLNS